MMARNNLEKATDAELLEELYDRIRSDTISVVDLVTGPLNQVRLVAKTIDGGKYSLTLTSR